MAENEISNEDLLALEKSLRLKLHPVQPDQEFVGALRKRLDQEAVRDQQNRLAISFLTIAGGLVIGLIVFVIGRIILHRKE